MSTGVLSYSHLEIAAAGPGRPLAILFADGEQRAGTVEYKIARAIACNRIFVRPAGRRWYHDGIPGLGVTIEETAQSLKRLVGELKPTHVVAIGASAGGYGALVLGCLIGADRILAFGAECHLMLPGSRSRQDMAAKAPGKFVDLTPHLQDRKPASVWLVAGDADIVELHCAAQVSRLPSVHAVAVRNAGHFNSRTVDDGTAFQELFLAAIGSSPSMPTPAVAGDMLNDRMAIAEAFEAHTALLAKQYDAALRHAGTAIERRPDWALAHHLHGRALGQIGRHADAEAAQARAIAIDPAQAAYHHHHGLALAQQGRFAEAAAAQQAALDRGLNNPWALHHLGVALYRAGDVAGAEAAHRRAAARRPKSALFHHHLAIALAELDRPAEAELAIRHALTLDPDNGDFRRQLGRILKAQGRSGEAEEAFTHADDIDPDGEAAQPVAAAPPAAEAPRPSAAPPPSSKDPEGLPASVADLLTKAANKDPEELPASVAALLSKAAADRRS
jgi:tetratricopeptide (TPR) repeat protein